MEKTLKIIICGSIIGPAMAGPTGPFATALGCRENMFFRLRTWEKIVLRVGTDAATTTATTYTRRPVHNTLRHGLEVIAEDATQQSTAAIVGDSLLRFPCCVAMSRRRTVL